jgi:hypothetical protein
MFQHPIIRHLAWNIQREIAGHHKREEQYEEQVFQHLFPQTSDVATMVQPAQHAWPGLWIQCCIHISKDKAQFIVAMLCGGKPHEKTG